MTILLRYRLAALLCLCLSSVPAVAESLSEEALMIKAAELTKLSTAVESAVRYEREQSANLDGTRLLQYATSQDPVLLSRFEGLIVRVSKTDEHASVLVCTADSQQALLEDAGCTAAMDRHAWRERPEAPCEFKLDLAALCSARSAAPRTAAAAMMLPTPRAAVAPLVQISKAVWTGDVSKATKQPATPLTKAPVGMRLVLWMQIAGSEEALEQLASRGKLPIRHKWFRETMIGIDPEGVATPTDEIEIPAASQGVMAKLRTELQTQGHFTWRTWSAKEKPSRGNWRVRVVYADNSPVMCDTGAGEKPCEYQIDVR